MASYNAEYPSGITVRPEVAAFFKEFYRVSDTPGLHDEYINQFTEDATFILASKVSKGSEGTTSFLSTLNPIAKV